MNADQRRGYFRRWTAVCRVHGWDQKDEQLRRDATFEATGQHSTTKLNQSQITDLFNWLDLQADPLNIDKAIPVANKDLARADEERRKFLHRIDALEFVDAYVVPVAKGFCNREGRSEWRKLSPASLEKLFWTLQTRARKRDADAGLRSPFNPRSEPYHQRKSTREKKAAAREPQVLPRAEVAEAMPF